MKGLVNCGFTTVLEPPVPANSGNTVVIPFGVTPPPTPFRIEFASAASPADQTNSEIAEGVGVVAGAHGQVITLNRAVEGPMGARAVQAGDICILSPVTAGLIHEVASGGTSPHETATTYAHPLGDDEADGSSWATAKRTINAAKEALPTDGEVLPSGELNRVGVINLGYAPGTEANPAFEVESKITAEPQCKFIGKSNPYQEERIPGSGKWKKQKGSPYVELQAGTGSAADVGKLLVNPRAPHKPLEAAEITDYWEGELDARGHKVAKAGTGKRFYTLSKNVVKQVTKGESVFVMLVVKPAIKLGAGVSLIGRGMTAGPKGRKERRAATCIVDKGNGMTIHIASGTPKKPTETRTRISDLSVKPAKPRLYRKEKIEEAGQVLAGEYDSTLPLWGIYWNNTFGVMLERLEVLGYMGWNIWAGNNGGVECEIRSVMCHEGGNIAGKIGSEGGFLTGCLYIGTGLNVASIINCNFLNGYGTCASVNGAHMMGNTFNHARSSFWEGKEINESGWNLLTGGGKVPSNLVGGWMEGGVNGQIRSGGYLTCVGVHFQGIGGEEISNSELEGEEETGEIEAWSNTEQYEAGDVVERSNKYWEALEPNEGVEPGTNPEVWEELAPALYSISGGGIFIACSFKTIKKACIKEAGSGVIRWINCKIGGIKRLKSKGAVFIERSGKAPNVPLFSGWGMGSCGGREEEGGELVGANVYYSQPVAPEELPTGGTAATYSNANGQDVLYEIPVTYEAGGELKREHSAGELWSQSFTPEKGPAGLTVTRVFQIKGGETLALTGASIKLGKAIVRWL